MDEFNQQQSNPAEQQNPNAGQNQGLAIASLIMGILSILLTITLIFPFIFGILAIVFGVLSLKSQKKGLAIAGIITGGVGLFLAMLIIVIGIVSAILFSENSPIDSQTVLESSNNSQSESDDSNNSQSESDDSNDDGMTTFSGDGFEVTYSKSLWAPITTTNGPDETIHALQYILDETILMPTGVSDMLGHSTSTKDGCDKLYMAFYDLLESSAEAIDAYISGGTETFEVLKDDIYYASYCIYNKDETLLFKAYVIASESDDMVVSFSAQTSFVTKAEPDIPIMPILKSITFTGRHAFSDPYVPKVWESDDEYTIGDDTIPSLSKIMNDNNISNTYIGGEKTIGRMKVPSILDFFDSPESSSELSSVEIIEITYNDVEDTWGAIDAYGRLLSESYDFYVTYPPTEYPNFGEDYRFCELIKKSASDEAGIIYVAALYSRDEKIIKVQFGTIGTPSIPNDGIGPLNLDAIEQSGLTP